MTDYLTNKQGAVLKYGKDKALRHRHHWIFSGAIASLPPHAGGTLLPVYSSEGECLGTAYFNRKTSIIGRMVSFGEIAPLDAIRNHIDNALLLRKSLYNENETNAYRLINGEGDFLPGLVVDRYADVLVMQLATLGMDKLRPFLLEELTKRLHPSCIYEKSVLPTRKEEGLPDFQAVLSGICPPQIAIKENGLRFLISVQEGQKTGFFLDQRQMRQQVRGLAQGKRVLNCFSYTGGFSVYAAAGGAALVDSVDISGKAIALARQNMALNQFGEIDSPHGFYETDVFDFLHNHPLNYDIVILDPPAFAKRSKDVIQGCRGYKEINRLALQKIPSGGLLLTSSCSYHVDEALFQKVVFQAAVDAGRNVRIIGRHSLAPDHPINLCHPEGDYLKSLLLYVS